MELILKIYDYLDICSGYEFFKSNKNYENIFMQKKNKLYKNDDLKKVLDLIINVSYIEKKDIIIINEKIIKIYKEDINKIIITIPENKDFLRFVIILNDYKIVINITNYNNNLFDYLIDFTIFFTDKPLDKHINYLEKIHVYDKYVDDIFIWEDIPDKNYFWIYRKNVDVQYIIKILQNIDQYKNFKYIMDYLIF